MTDEWEWTPGFAYAQGARAAWLDWRTGGMACLLGAGLWAGLPRTAAFYAGYRSVYRLPPARRWPWVALLGGASARGASPARPWPSDASRFWAPSGS